MIQGTVDEIFGVIWITMLTLQIENSGNMGVISCLGQGDLYSLSALVLCIIQCSDCHILSSLIGSPTVWHL